MPDGNALLGVGVVLALATEGPGGPPGVPALLPLRREKSSRIVR